MQKRLQSGLLFAFPITCIIFFIVIGCIAQSFQLDDSLLKVSSAADFNNGWVVNVGGETRPMDEIPRSLAAENGPIVIENTLPVFSGDDYVLCFKSINETISVSSGSREVFSYGLNDRTPFGSHFGSVWLFVPLDESLAGETISIEINSLSDIDSLGRYHFYLDHRSTVFLTLLGNNAFLYINCLLCVTCAFLLLCSSLLHLKDGWKLSRMRLFLGTFTLLGQLWAFSDGGILQGILSNKAISYFITHSTFMLMPVPFLLYLAELFPRWEKQYRRLNVCFCAYYLVRLLLYAADLLDLGACVGLTHGLIIISICFVVFMTMADSKAPVNQITLAGLFLFFAFVFLTILVFYLNPAFARERLNYTLVLSLGVDVLLIFFYSALIKGHEVTAIHASRFERQAYTDAMTQVKNRAALNLEIEQLDAASYPRLSLLMVDLNNLKQVNDTLGHPIGDRLICELVHCLEGAFGEMGSIYRYGGDEFVVIIPDSSEEEVQRAREQFDQLLLQRSNRGGCEISVALGMASRMNEQHASLHVSELLHLADIAMYHIKARQKSANASIPAMRHHWMEQIDAATGILTFSAFKARVYDALASAEFDFPCIVNFDLNFFDGYNNLFGWDAGNQLLQRLTSMAMNLCGKKGFCAHGDADSFWVFADTPDLGSLENRITEETKRFQQQLGDCLLFPSFGIYCINEYMSPVSDMCSRATSAKKTIKGHFDMLYAVYNPEDHLRRIDNMKLTSYMQKGLDSNEFSAAFQPKFTPDGKHLVGAEALARWHRTTDPASSPAEFTDLFEKSGLILTLDWYILEKTCMFLRRQLDKGNRCVPVSINFSRLHVYEDDCVERMRRLVNSYHLPHRLIEIELTESAFVQSSERMQRLITGLRKEDFVVALDDFGKGLSSLGLLRKTSVDVIKVDRHLLENSIGLEPDRSILCFVINLCRQLNIQSVIEGVETKAQFDMLQKYGCDVLQGNFLAPAMTEESFETLLSDHQAEIVERNGRGIFKGWLLK